MELLRQLKSINSDGASLDELLMCVAVGKSLRAEYELHGLTSPEWLDGTIRVASREAKIRTEDIVEVRLRELEQAEASLAGRDEKLARIREERERLLSQRRKAETVGAAQ